MTTYTWSTSRSQSSELKSAEEGRAAFEESHVLQDAIIRNFEVIGGTVKQLSPELFEQYDEVPWRRIAGFRDILIHDYMGVDLEEVTDP